MLERSLMFGSVNNSVLMDTHWGVTKCSKTKSNSSLTGKNADEKVLVWNEFRTSNLAQFHPVNHKLNDDGRKLDLLF